MADANAGRASYELGADLRPLRKDLNAATGEIKKSGAAAEKAFAQQGKGAADKMAASQGLLVRQAGELKKGVLAGVGIGGGLLAFNALAGAVSGVTDFIGGSVDAARQFEDELATINTVAGLTESELDDLGRSIQDLSEESGKSTSELTTGFYDLVSAGVDANRAIDVLRDSSTLATGALSTTGEAVDLITTTLNAWKLEATESTRVMDVWAQTVTNGKVTASELAASMAQIAPIASAMGVSIEEVAAGFATMTAQGTPATMAATQMKAAIAALIKPNAELAELQETLNGTTFEAMLRNEGLAVTLQAVSDAAGGNTDSITKALGGTEAYNAMLQLTGASAGAFAGNLEDMRRAATQGGVAVGQLAEKQKTLQFREDQLAAKQQRLMQDLGAALMPVMEGITDVTSGAIDVIIGLAEGINGLIDVAKNLADPMRGFREEVDQIAQESIPRTLLPAFERWMRVQGLSSQASGILKDQMDSLGITIENQGAVWDHIAQVAEASGVSVEDVMTQMATEFQKAQGDLAFLAEGMDTAADKAQRQGERYAILGRALDHVTEAFDLTKEELKELNPTLEEAQAKVLEWMNTTAEGAEAMVALQNAIHGTTPAIAAAGGALGPTATRAQLLAAGLAAIGATAPVAEGGLKRIQKEANQTDRAWKRLNERGDDNKRSIRELDEQIDKWQRRYNRAVKNNNSARAKFAADEIIRLTEERDARQEVVDETKALHEELDDLPKKTNALVDVEVTGKAALDRLAATLRSLPPVTVARISALTGGLPEFHSGVDFVPRTGLAVLERGERVISKEANRRLLAGDSGGSGSGISGRGPLTVNVSVNAGAFLGRPNDAELFARQVAPAIGRELERIGL